MSNFTQTYTTFQGNASKRIMTMTLKLKIKDATGNVGFTDLMLQRGTISTIWAAHPSEIKWTANE